MQFWQNLKTSGNYSAKVCFFSKYDDVCSEKRLVAGVCTTHLTCKRNFPKVFNFQKVAFPETCSIFASVEARCFL